jgi:hypothetical protein
LLAIQKRKKNDLKLADALEKTNQPRKPNKRQNKWVPNNTGIGENEHQTKLGVIPSDN